MLYLIINCLSREGITLKLVINKIWGIIEKRKYITYTMIAFVCCLILLGIMIQILPEAKAAGETIDAPISLSVGTSTNVSGNTYYLIGGDVPQTYVAGFTLNYQDDGSGNNDVYLIIRNATFNMSSDIPAITIKAKNETVNLHIILDGDNEITGIAGANQPLIKAESYILDKLVVNAYASTNEDFFQPKEEIQDINIIISSIDSTNDNSLTLVTGVGSYGAAIGSAESQSLVNGIGVTLASGSLPTATYPLGSSVTNPTTYYNGEEILSGNLEYGSADVVIESGKINITGQGYGSGIGLGGSRTTNVLITSGFDSYPQDTLGSLGSVKINNGTISVVMTPSSMGSVFMNSSVNGGSAASDGRVTIDGGSVYLVRQGKNSADDPYTNAYNSLGEKLYLYTAHYVEDNIAISNSYDMVNDCEGEENYTYYINNIGYSVMPSINYIDTIVTLSSTTYDFSGFVHDGGAYGDSGILYFYLPTSVLNRHSFSIQDDGREDIIYSYFITDPSGVAEEQLASKYTVIQENSTLEVKQNKRIYIRLTNVPDYTKNINFNFVLTGTSSSSLGTSSIYTALDGSKYTYVDIGDSDAVCTFSYEMESYSVIYDMGLLPVDGGAVITNTNLTSLECGTSSELLNPSWDGNHHFAGWLDSQGNDITSVYSDVAGDIITVYAKWECNVVYMDDGNELSSVVISYGDYITNGSNPVSPVSSELIEFLGWNVNGTTYDESTTYSFQVVSDMNITAVYKRTGYYVYIKGIYVDGDGNESTVDISDYSVFDMVYENETAIDFQDINQQNYYRTVGFVDMVLSTTATVAPSEGYYISGKTIVDVYNNSINLVASEDDQNAFSFTMPEVDVYITIYFKAKDYTITYYDLDEENNVIEVIPDQVLNNNPSSYNLETPNIIFNPLNTRGKYFKFEGWYELTNNSLPVTGILSGSLTKNLILIAKWNNVDLYDIIINDEEGDTKAYIDGESIDKGAEGEEVTIIAQSVSGMRLVSVSYTWTNSDGSVLTNTKYPDGDGIDEIKEVKFIMPSTEVTVTSIFEPIEYNINYINLNGGENNNPYTYTVKDNIILSDPVLDGYEFMGWKIIEPDTEVVDQVKLTDITDISNRTGNILLTANWNKVEETVNEYAISVDENIVNGTVTVNKNITVEGDYVFVYVDEPEGYELESINYEYVESELPVQTLFMATSFSVMSLPMEIDIKGNKLADNVYYFVMVDKNVEVSAVFKPIEYSITYLESGINENVALYTIEDDIVLEDSIREGYTFLGWFNEEDELVKEITESTGELTLTAHWMALVTEETTEVTKVPIETDTKEETSSNENEITTDSIGSTGTTGTTEEINTSSEEETVVYVGNNKNSSLKNNTFLGDSSITTGDKTDISFLIIIGGVAIIIAIGMVFVKNKSDK